jgi:hypothetical protein
MGYRIFNTKAISGVDPDSLDVLYEGHGIKKIAIFDFDIVPVDVQKHIDIVPVDVQKHIDIVPVNVQKHIDIVPVDVQKHIDIVPADVQTEECSAPI